MKFLIVLACLIAAVSAVPAAIFSVAPAAVTYQSQQQSLVPVGTKLYSTVSHGPAVITAHAAPVLAAPVVHGAPLGLAAPIGHLGLAPALAYSKTYAAPALLGAPILH